MLWPASKMTPSPVSRILVYSNWGSDDAVGDVAWGDAAGRGAEGRDDQAT